MKKRHIVYSLILTLALGVGATAYASTETISDSNTSNPVTSTTTAASSNERVGLRRITGMAGYDFMSQILKDKLNLSDEEIDKARLEGKTLYDIANEKGVSHDDLKNAMLDSKYKAIDNAASQGTITKEQADSYKETLKNNSLNAVPGESKANGRRGLNSGNNRNGAKDGTRAGRGSGRMNSNNCLIE